MSELSAILLKKAANGETLVELYNLITQWVTEQLESFDGNIDEETVKTIINDVLEESFVKATLEEAEAGTDNSKYITPYTAFEAFRSRKTDATKFASGVYGSDEYVDPDSLLRWWKNSGSGGAKASSSEVLNGTNVSRYVSPKFLKTAVQTWINDAITSANSLTEERVQEMIDESVGVVMNAAY